MGSLTFAVAWRVLVWFLLGLPMVVIKHVAINHYGCDPYRVGQILGSVGLAIYIALTWRWLPVRLTLSETAKPPRPTPEGRPS